MKKCHPKKTTKNALSPTVENYLKHLFAEQQQQPDQLVPMGKLAAALGVAPGTATIMVKALAKSGLVEYTARDGVRLSVAGERSALQVIRRHRLVEQFLVEILGLDWAEVHDEAEELEHSISEKVLNRLDAFLGHPQFDPHGDPIPGGKGRPSKNIFFKLADGVPGQSYRIVRILNQEPQFLNFIHERGLKPGTRVTIKSCDLVAEYATVAPESKTAVTIGTAAAAKILVQPI